MTGFESKRAMAANKLQEPAQPVADWDSPQVRIVYEILIDGETPPNPDEHWEGFVAQKIVAALAQPAQEPVAFDAFLESEDFYNLMQTYRHFQTDAAKPFEVVKDALRAAYNIGEKLYTAPPQRQWIWLSDADIAEMVDTTCQYTGSYEEFLIKKAERKIRSMNT